MNTQETVDQLRTLKLKGMMEAYQSLITMPVHEQLTLHQAIFESVTARNDHRGGWDSALDCLAEYLATA